MSDTKHIPGLDAVRALAVTGVIAHHLALPASAIGWTGVNLFFVLSGFLITGILLADRDKPDFFRTFYSRRSLRIFPIYYLLIVALLISGVVAGENVSHWPFFATYTQNWLWTALPSFADDGLTHFPWGASHTWSLAIEEQFYLLWPLVVWALSAKNLLRAAIAIIVAGIACRYLGFAATGKWWAGYAPLFSQMDMLAWGALGALFVRNGRSDALGRAAGMGAVAFGALIAWAYFALSRDVRTPEYLLTSPVGHAVFAVFGPFYLCLLLLSTQTGPLTFLLELPPVRYVARISYGLYLYHWPMIVLFDPLDHGAPHERWPRTAMVLGSTLVIAVLSYHLVERPILKAKDVWFPRKAPRLAGGAEGRRTGARQSEPSQSGSAVQSARGRSVSGPRPASLGNPPA
jgi:peptidoglycan/LPS O-acetylase OafA/YrhL